MLAGIVFVLPPGSAERAAAGAGLRVARRISRNRPLADLVLGPEINPGNVIGDDDADGLARSIRSRVSSCHHPVGTCAMGPDPATGAVVNARGAVHSMC